MPYSGKFSEWSNFWIVWKLPQFSKIWRSRGSNSAFHQLYSLPYVDIDVVAANAILSLRVSITSRIHPSHVTTVRVTVSRSTWVNFRRVWCSEGCRLYGNLTYEHLTQYKGVDISEILAFWKIPIIRYFTSLWLFGTKAKGYTGQQMKSSYTNLQLIMSFWPWWKHFYLCWFEYILFPQLHCISLALFLAILLFIFVCCTILVYMCVCESQ